MKLGGYSDSGADIAFELKKNGIIIVTPVNNPNIKNGKEIKRFAGSMTMNDLKKFCN